MYANSIARIGDQEPETTLPCWMPEPSSPSRHNPGPDSTWRQASSAGRNSIDPIAGSRPSRGDLEDGPATPDRHRDTRVSRKQLRWFDRCEHDHDPTGAVVAADDFPFSQIWLDEGGSAEPLPGDLDRRGVFREIALTRLVWRKVLDQAWGDEKLAVAGGREGAIPPVLDRTANAQSGGERAGRFDGEGRDIEPVDRSLRRRPRRGRRSGLLPG